MIADGARNYQIPHLGFNDLRLNVLRWPGVLALTGVDTSTRSIENNLSARSTEVSSTLEADLPPSDTT